MIADTTFSQSQTRNKNGILRLIGVFKLLKGVLLIGAVIGTLHLLHRDINEEIVEVAHRFHIAPGNKILERFLDKALTITTKQLKVLAGIFAVYAAMYTIEGIGLLLAKRWAEWMTVITTVLLIPIEIYEIVHRVEGWKIVTLIINVAVAVYLTVRVWRETAAHSEDAAHPTN